MAINRFKFWDMFGLSEKPVQCPRCKKDVMPVKGGAYTAGEADAHKALLCPLCKGVIDDVAI